MACFGGFRFVFPLPFFLKNPIVYRLCFVSYRSGQPIRQLQTRERKVRTLGVLPQSSCGFAPEWNDLDYALVPAHERGCSIRYRIGSTQKHRICGVYVTGCDRTAFVANDCADRNVAVAKICAQ